MQNKLSAYMLVFCPRNFLPFPFIGILPELAPDSNRFSWIWLWISSLPHRMTDSLPMIHVNGSVEKPSSLSILQYSNTKILKYCLEFQALHERKDIDKLVAVQWKAIKMIRDLEGGGNFMRNNWKCCGSSLWRKENYRDMTTASQLFRRLCRKWRELFTVVSGERARNNGLQI